jgi:hypothetical protein
MAEYVAETGEVGAVALFPGGDGTASMYREALRVSIEIFDFRK